MKQVDTLIIAGASITASPWFTWADIAIETLKPKTVVNLSARGAGNYYIVLSCINAILNNNLSGNTLCMPMFTSIDKFDMYLDQAQTQQYANEKHAPLSITGNLALDSEFGFWSTGSHWPGVKQQYLTNFYRSDIACVNTLMLFHTLETLCKEKHIDLVPLFDMDIWSYSEQELNQHVTTAAPLTTTDLLAQPCVKNFKSLLPNNWIEFTSLIGYALEHGLPVYDKINKLHPPSSVHARWFATQVRPQIEHYVCVELSQHFVEKIQHLSQAWKNDY